MSGAMTYSPADVTRKLLLDLGLGTDISAKLPWPVFAYSEPSLPDNCITIYDTTGIDEGRTGPDSEKQVHQGLSVRVRSIIPSLGYTKMDAVAIAIDRVVGRWVTMEDASTHYLIHAVTRSGSPSYIGQDYPNGKRSVFTLNAIISVRQR